MDIIDNQPFMFLEWIARDENHRTDLRSWLRRGPLELQVALDFAIDICRGLIHAGQNVTGIVNRDLKPANILVAQGSVAKITDFGLAKIVQDSKLEIPIEQSQLSEHQHLSNMGGTPPYMAPEQWRGEELDARTDIYAIGCILYEMLAGQKPFAGATIDELRRQHLNAAIPRLMAFAILPTDMDTILKRCLAKRRDERFATINELVQELSKIYQRRFAEAPRNTAICGEFSATDYSNRGLTYGKLQRYNEALANLNQAIQLDSTYALAYSNRGNIYGRLQRYDDALADHTLAIELDPTNVQFYYNRGTTYAKLKRYTKAMEDFTYIIQLNPSFAPAYFSRGVICYELQRDDEALADFTHVIQLDPTFAKAFLSIGVLLNSRGALREALLYFEKAAQLGDPVGMQSAEEVKQQLKHSSS